MGIKDEQEDQNRTAAAVARENKEVLSCGDGSQGQKGESRFQKYLGA